MGFSVDGFMLAKESLHLWKVLVVVHCCVCEGEEAKKVGLFGGKELIKKLWVVIDVGCGG